MKEPKTPPPAPSSPAPSAPPPQPAPTRFLTDFDLHLFSEGTHYRTYEKLGAHLCEQGGKKGAHFAVWAPNARAVSVIGDWNYWSWGSNRLDAGFPFQWITSDDYGATWSGVHFPLFGTPVGGHSAQPITSAFRDATGRI